jgi:hypothetical protein
VAQPDSKAWHVMMDEQLLDLPLRPVAFIDGQTRIESEDLCEGGR